MATLQTLASPATGTAPVDHSSIHPLIAVDIPRAELEAFLGRVPEAELMRRAIVSWESPKDDIRLLGFGDAARLTGTRDSAFSDAHARLRALMWHTRAETTSEARPRIFGGLRFRAGGRVHYEGWDAFGGWQFVLPRVLIAFTSHGVFASFVTAATNASVASNLAIDALHEIEQAVPATPAAPPYPANPATGDEYQAKVAAAVEEIEDGKYQKTVLALQSRLELGADVHQGLFLQALASRYPDCFTFRFVAGESAWLGASPELLIRRNGSSVRTASLAGSRPRGVTPEQDDALAEALYSSEKEREEHQLVVEAVRDSLATLCDDLVAPNAPQILRVANIQHLYTPITGELRPGADILDLVEALHPTPAVGGSPRKPALDAIEAIEGMDRGWYAAPFGWFDLKGDGVFAVALRSGLVHGSHVDLFAGAGIVHGSEPASELAEVQQKLRALRGTLETMHG